MDKPNPSSPRSFSEKKHWNLRCTGNRITQERNWQQCIKYACSNYNIKIDFLVIPSHAYKALAKYPTMSKQGNGGWINYFYPVSDSDSESILQMKTRKRWLKFKSVSHNHFFVLILIGQKHQWGDINVWSWPHIKRHWGTPKFDVDFHLAFKHGKLLGSFSFHVYSVGNKILFVWSVESLKTSRTTTSWL